PCSLRDGRIPDAPQQGLSRGSQRVPPRPRPTMGAIAPIVYFIRGTGRTAASVKPRPPGASQRGPYGGPSTAPERRRRAGGSRDPSAGVQPATPTHTPCTRSATGPAPWAPAKRTPSWPATSRGSGRTASPRRRQRLAGVLECCRGSPPAGAPAPYRNSTAWRAVGGRPCFVTRILRPLATSWSSMGRRRAIRLPAVISQ
ncbi:hypothetical protein LCGC14_2547140, partial [marine sediment metagenome]